MMEVDIVHMITEKDTSAYDSHISKNSFLGTFLYEVILETISAY